MIEYAKGNVISELYDIDITGYGSKSNRLHLFDVKEVDESLVKQGICFDKDDFAHNMTLFLYPDDSDRSGRLLRIYQQYFMVSNAARYILDEMRENGYSFETLASHVVIQINDTHPSMIIPELIRLLMEEGIGFLKAVDIVKETCAYTNHTILAEALEKWPYEYIEEVVPQLLPIIQELNQLAGEDLAIIDKDRLVHMAHMDIHFSFSVNGVARLHTEILKNTELHDFYLRYPDKFNNKTNGITFRRWLYYANPELTSWIEGLIGNSFKRDAMELERLLDFKDERICLQQLILIKEKKKEQLCEYLVHSQNIRLNKEFIFDIQIKRMHEYKRQQLNVLYIDRKSVV